MQLEGTDLPVWAMEIDPDKAKQQFRNYSATEKGTKVDSPQCQQPLMPTQPCKLIEGSRDSVLCDNHLCGHRLHTSHGLHECLLWHHS